VNAGITRRQALLGTAAVAGAAVSAGRAGRAGAAEIRPAVGSPVGSSLLGATGVAVVPSDWGETDPIAALNDWAAVLGRPVKSYRDYHAAGSIPATITTTLQECANNKIRALISLKPAYNPVSSTDLASINSFLSSCHNAGLDAVVAIWHEPVPQGLTTTQYIAAVKYYGPTIRQYYPLTFNQSCYPVASGSVVASAYYPGDAYVDQVTVDYYTPDYDESSTVLATCMAVADSASPPKPFGIWESNGNTAYQTQANITAYFGTISSTLGNRLGGGKVNADYVFYNHSDGTDNCQLVSSSSDFRVALLQGIYGAYNIPYVMGSAVSSAAETTLTATLAAAQRPGSKILAYAASNSGSIPTISDSKSNSWLTLVAETNDFQVYAFESTGTTLLAVGDTVTISGIGASGEQGLAIAGVPATAADQSVSAYSSGSTAPSVTSGTLAQANEAAVAFAASGNSAGALTWAWGWTPLFSSEHAQPNAEWVSLAYQLTTSEAAVTASGSLAVSGKWGALLTTLKLA
jgi:hypothetical protein